MQENKKMTKELTDEELMELAGGFTQSISPSGLFVALYAISPITSLKEAFKNLFK